MPLDIVDVEKSLDELVASGIKALCVCLLWSFLDPTHERKIRDLVKRKYPGLFVSISSEVAPRTGEYERSVSTAFNSYIGPIVGDYLTRLERRLKELGMPCSLLVVQSNGGLSTVGSMLGKPLVIVNSGPAGGVLGARYPCATCWRRRTCCVRTSAARHSMSASFSRIASRWTRCRSSTATPT